MSDIINKRNARSKAILKEAKKLAKDVQKGRIHDVELKVVKEMPKAVKSKPKAVKPKTENE